MAERRGGGRSTWDEYSPQDYEFPELYVYGKKSERLIWVDVGARRYYRAHRGGTTPYGLVPLESAIGEVLDVEGGFVRTAFVVLVPWLGWRGMLVDVGTKFSVIEAWGVEVNPVSLEGARVGDRSILAYVLTGKGETRTLRSGVEGVVVGIFSDLTVSPPRYLYVVVDEESIVWLEPGD